MKKISTTLTGKSRAVAYEMLFSITELLDKNSIEYHLEGGTLLGIARDNALLPWDHDVDISIPQSEVDKLLKLKFQLFKLGYKFSVRKSKFNFGPIKKGDLSLFKIKPLFRYIGHLLIPSLHRNMVILDIFVKVPDDSFTYWQAMGKVMKVDKSFYESYDTITFRDRILRAPNNYKDYLTQKYGDWSVIVKDWCCGNDEKTICK